MIDVKALSVAVMIGLAYSLWPVAGKYLGLSGPWIATLVVTGTAMSAIGLSISELRSSALPVAWLIVTIVLIGAINGVGSFAHSNKAADPAIKIGIFSAMIYVTQVVGSPLLDRLINGTRLSWSQVGAVVMGIATVILASL